jgi:hypothetical protein
LNRLLDSQMELKDQQILDALYQGVRCQATARMCHMASGKWIRNDVKLCELADIGVVIETLEGHAAFLDKIQVQQPVGISFQIEHEKYIFDSTVLGFESAITAPGGRILIEMPDFMEKMPRRSYERQSVPSNLNVQVLPSVFPLKVTGRDI